MKKVLSAGVGLVALAIAMQQAAAADLPRKAVYKAAPVEVFSWSGFYIGIHGGGGWGDKVANQVPTVIPGIGTISSPESTTDISGGLVGGQIGFNVQTGMFVWGIEAQASWANLRGSTSCQILLDGVPLSTACTGTSEVEALGTIAARLGIAFDRTLVYAKGGAAWADDKYNVAITIAAPFPPAASADEFRWGWMVGGGIEQAFASNWSAKIEYNYMDLGTERVRFTATDGSTNDADIRQRLHVVKVGVNYRFGGPVYAKY